MHMSCSDQTPSPSMRSLSEVSEDHENMRLSLDLVAAARHNIGFLRNVADSHWLHHTPLLLEALRRYDELWMPMVCDLTVESGKPPMILPPLDVEWVWFCHTLNPVAYREYCDTRFSKLIGKPPIFNQENKDYALERCKERWMSKYPSESFENEVSSDDPHTNILQNDYLFREISKHKCLLTKFSKPYMLELVYLIAAKNRYKGFLFMLQRFADSCTAFVPTSDILLMWITHKSYPIAYATDVKDMEENMSKIIESGEPVKEEDLEVMKKLWERVFDQPYEKAGCVAIDDTKPLICWEVTDTDVNVKYRSLLPRFLLEVNMLVKQTAMPKTLQKDVSKEFLRFQFLRCHRDCKTCWSDGTHERTEICDFMVLPANSNHDILLGREGIARFNANASTAHAMVGFPTKTGIAFIRGNKDCHTTETAKPPKMVKTDTRTEPEKWVLNPKFPEQTVIIGHEISETIRNHLKQLLISNIDVFAWQPADMVGVPRDIAEHRLNVYRSVEPIVQKKRSMGPEKTKAMNEQVTELLNAGILRPIRYQTWVANPVMVAKANGGWRMCVDYKDINKACPKDCYPLPEIDLKVDSLAPYPFKCFLDAYKGYHQIQMAKEDEDKTAFRTDAGIFCYTKMPFGLKNAGATYQRLMDTAFINEIGVRLEVYVDDLVIKSKEESDMIK